MTSYRTDVFSEPSGGVKESGELCQRFRELVRYKELAKFESWLSDCLASEISELVSFARGLESDRAAIEAGISSFWSNGQTEGRVNKLKLSKRQLYGRGSFELLRQKVLLAG
jgi:transposase